MKAPYSILHVGITIAVLLSIFFQLSVLQISSQEKMMESKVPQGIKGSLGFSSVSTDITGILLH